MPEGLPKSLASDSAMATSFIVAGDASQTGLVKPMSLLSTLRPLGRSVPTSFQSRHQDQSAFCHRQNLAVASDDTQFTHWPAWVTPTENVQSSRLMASIAIMVSAIFRIAERPSDNRSPAWLGRPKVLTL